MRTPLFTVAVLALTACHGIEHPSPAAPSTVTLTPTTIALVSSPPTLPLGGGTASIDVSVLAGGSGIRDARVALSASTGHLAAASVATDATGHATVEWSGDRSGTIAATMGELAASVIVHVTEAAPPGPDPEPHPSPGPTPTPSPPPGGVSIGIDTGSRGAYATEATRLTAGVQILPPSAATIAWDVNGDGVADATTNPLEWTFPAPGTQVVHVVVTTADGRRGEASARLTVHRVDELETEGVLASATSIDVGQGVTWSIPVTIHNGSFLTLKYLWTFEGANISSSTDAMPDAEYATEGDFAARVTVTASDEQVVTKEARVTVTVPKAVRR